MSVRRPVSPPFQLTPLLALELGLGLLLLARSLHLNPLPRGQCEYPLLLPLVVRNPSLRGYH